MKLSLPLVLLAFGFACAGLSVGQAEGSIFSKNPLTFSVRPVSNPFNDPLRTKGRKLMGGTTTPAANTEDEGPPTCTEVADCDHLLSNPIVPNSTSFDCTDGMIYGYPLGNVCGVVCDTDTYCEDLGNTVGWPAGTTCHKETPSSTSGVCKFPGGVVGGENICKDQTKFNATRTLSDDMSCGSIKMICNNLRDVGGLVKEYMTPLVNDWVPLCCGVETGTGKDHYNPESGCGSMSENETESNEQLMCGPDPDNKFMPEAVVEGECKSESDDKAERCHEERCRSEKAYCESKRGQLVERDDERRYPNDLVYVTKFCRDEIDACSYFRFGGTHHGCQFTNDDGGTERCIDRECNQDEATCLSREGKPIPTDPSKVYSGMKWVESEGEGSFLAKMHELRHTVRLSEACCSKGRDPSYEYFSPSCHKPDVKDEMFKHMGCEAEKFSFGREINFGWSKSKCSDMMHRCQEIAMKKGRCSTPDHRECHDQECTMSKEGCHARRGKDGFGHDLEFEPYSFFEAALNMNSLKYSLSLCCDGEIQLEECKPHPDVPVLDLEMCKTGTFQPSKELTRGECRALEHGEDEHVQYSCDESECQNDPAYCESRSGQMVDDDENYRIYANLTFTRHTCGMLMSRATHMSMERGDCGEWYEGHFHTKCHESTCKNSKATCEAKGFTFKPFTQSEVEERNRHWAQHYFNSDSVESYGICCGGAENLRTTDYPYTLEPLNIPEGYIVGSEEKGCEKCDCCGHGTTCKDGRCYPTLLGAIEACKVARGEKWAWTCDGEAQCASNVNTRRLQRTPQRGVQWGQGWRASMPSAHGSVPRNQRRRAAHRSSQHRPSSWNQPNRVGNQAPRHRQRLF